MGSSGITLIYAYMIENTRIYEIFRRVVHELLHGEKLALRDPRVSRVGGKSEMAAHDRGDCSIGIPLHSSSPPSPAIRVRIFMRPGATPISECSAWI